MTRTLTAAGGPAPAGPSAAGRHQHESDRHGDCQAGTEWRDRPGQYKPDSDSAGSGSDRARSPSHPGPGPGPPGPLALVGPGQAAGPGLYAW